MPNCIEYIFQNCRHMANFQQLSVDGAATAVKRGWVSTIHGYLWLTTIERCLITIPHSSIFLDTVLDVGSQTCKCLAKHIFFQRPARFHLWRHCAWIYCWSGITFFSFFPLNNFVEVALPPFWKTQCIGRFAWMDISSEK